MSSQHSLDRQALLTQAAPTDIKRICEIIALRRVLEPEIAALATLNATPQDVERIRHILERQAEAAGLGQDTATIDARFHLALARACKNEVFREVVAVLYDMLGECRAAALQSPERERMSLEGHRVIVEALERQDPDGCRQAMQNHLDALELRLCGRR